jgi:hypothetical protein
MSDSFPENQIDLEWWDPTSTHTFKVLMNATRKAINSFKVRDVEATDIINAALMGIPLDPSKDLGKSIDQGRLRPAYELGKKDLHGPQNIVNGQITPQGVAGSGLAKAMFNRVSDYAKARSHETHMPVDDEGGVFDIQDTTEKTPAWEFMASLFFHDKDPVARQVQKIMDTVWEGSPMENWLATVRLTGTYPTQSDMAKQLGMSKANMSQNHWRPKWEALIHAIWADKNLVKQIRQRMIQEGVEEDLPEALVEVVHHTSRMAHQVASLFRIRSLMDQFPDFIIRSAGREIR